MMKISAQQLEAMAHLRLERFIRSSALYLREAFAEAVTSIPDAELLELVRSTVARALGYQLTSEGEVHRFLEFAVIHGWAFELEPSGKWAAEILSDPSLDETAKMNALKERLAANTYPP